MKKWVVIIMAGLVLATQVAPALAQRGTPPSGGAPSGGQRPPDGSGRPGGAPPPRGGGQGPTGQKPDKPSKPTTPPAKPCVPQPGHRC